MRRAHTPKMDRKQSFAQRLNAALDARDFPPKHKGRHVELARVMGVSPKGASFWLNGDKLPSAENIIELSDRLGICAEWLWVGRGSMDPIPPLTDEESSHLAKLRSLPLAERQKALRVFDALTSDAQNPAQH